jgi:Mn-dependent DtxR family transcriptional regulator
MPGPPIVAVGKAPADWCTSCLKINIHDNSQDCHVLLGWSVCRNLKHELPFISKVRLVFHSGSSRTEDLMGDWTFFSNHGHVLVCLSRNHDARLRDVAAEVGITERAVQKIVRDLQDAGFLVISKQGRCNRYRINRRKSLRHDLESHCTVGKLLSLVSRAEPRAEPRAEQENAGVEPPAVSAVPDTQTEPGEASPTKKEEVADKPVPPDTRQQGSLF